MTTTPTAITDAFIPQDTVARRLGVSVRTLQAWRAQGYGPPAIRPGPIGGRVRFRASDLQVWVEAQRDGQPTPPTAA